MIDAITCQMKRLIPKGLERRIARFVFDWYFEMLEPAEVYVPPKIVITGHPLMLEAFRNANESRTFTTTGRPRPVQYVYEASA